MPRETTTIRAPMDWLVDLDAWALEHDLSRTSALIVLTRIGMRAVRELHLSQRQLEALIAGE